MARITTVQLIDDVDKTSEAVETIHYVWDGHAYEIHLTAEHADQFRTIMEEWVEHSALLPEESRRKGGPRRTGNRDENQKIRNWLRGQGIQVPERGRLRTEYVIAYRAAHSL